MNFNVNTTIIEPFERIEFGFVLLPEEDILQKIKLLSEMIYLELQNLRILEKLPAYWGTYKNKKAKFPHISIGQYGVLGVEIEDIKNFVKEISNKTSIIIERMKPNLSVLDDHVFFDVENYFENINPKIRDLYLVLRGHYFNKIQTKFSIAQSLLYKKTNPHNAEEISFINLYFQIWGIPEGNRIRPHFTMLYHPPFKRGEIEEHLYQNSAIKNKLNELNTIRLSRIGVVQIDTFGNSLRDGLICAFPLNNG